VLSALPGAQPRHFALVAGTGFAEAVVDYHPPASALRVSGWTYGRMLKTMYDTFIGFALMPIRIMTIPPALWSSLLTLHSRPYFLYVLIQRTPPCRDATRLMLGSPVLRLQFPDDGVVGLPVSHLCGGSSGGLMY